MQNKLVDQASIYTLKRFAVRLALLLLLALAQIISPLGFVKALQLLFVFMTLTCAGIAAWKHESFARRELGHWDEAALFLMLGVGFHVIAIHVLRNGLS